MSVEESPDGIILLKGNIIEYATNLFDEKEYFGAFSRIHSLIEIWMQVLYEKKLEVNWYQDFLKELDKKRQESKFTRRFARHRLWQAMLWILLVFYTEGDCLFYVATFFVV